MRQVNEGCPKGEIVNPYRGAYCRTMPCTIADIDVCCIPNPGALYQRTDLLRSMYPRIIPDESADPVSPKMTFSYKEIVWINMDRKQTIGKDEWAPLVDFMAYWGEGFGWNTEAWIRVSKNGKQSYKEVPTAKLGLEEKPVSPEVSSFDDDSMQWWRITTFSD